MDWRERYERAAARYAAGETRELDERQLAELAVSAGRLGCPRSWTGTAREPRSGCGGRGSGIGRVGTRPAHRMRGRPLGAMKALLIVGDDASGAARWALDARPVHAESLIGRDAAASRCSSWAETRRPALDRDSGDGFPSDVAEALSALAHREPARYRTAVDSVRRSFEEREASSRTSGARHRSRARGARGVRRPG